MTSANSATTDSSRSTPMTSTPCSASSRASDPPNRPSPITATEPSLAKVLGAPVRNDADRAIQFFFSFMVLSFLGRLGGVVGSR